MDESEVEPDSDMKTHQVNDMTAEDLTVRIRYSSQNNDECNESAIKQEPYSDGETDSQPSHCEDQVPAPFSFVAVKSEIVHDDESWDSTTVKEELKDISTGDFEECDREEKLCHQQEESSSYGSSLTEANGHKQYYGVHNVRNCSDADDSTHNEVNITATTGVIPGNVNSNKIRRKKRNSTGDKSYKCDECNRMFARKEHLMRHYRTHTGEKPYKCDICNKFFSQNGTLKGHYRTHTGEKPYSCNVCNRRFAENVNLKNHYRIHTEERLHKCEICSKVFSMRVSLKTHYRSHMGGKTHKCEICRKEFSKGDNLRKHYRTHTGEKPHKCDRCGKQFSVSANLKRHIRTHTGEKPYKCDLCNKEYSKSEHLKTHQRTHVVV